MLVSNVMNSNVVHLSPDDTVARAARLLARHNIGSLPICTKEGVLRGVVTDRDIAVRCVAYDNPPEDTKLREIMTRGVITVSPDDDTTQALKIMADEQIRRLPVVDRTRLVGMLSLSDIAIRHSRDAEISSALSEISTPRGKYKRR